MKMKKIISLFAVMTMMASFAISAKAAVQPSIEVKTANIEEMADNSAYPAAVDGYTRYLVSYSIKGLDSDYIDANGLTGLQVKYVIDSGAENVNAKTFKAKDKGKNSGVHATFENCGTTLFQEGFFAIASTDGLYYDGETSLIDTVWYVKDDTSVTFSFVTSDKTGMYVSYGNWDAIATDTTDYYACEGNLPMNVTSITLGSAPAVEDKPVTMDTPVAGNDMYGMKTALTEITFKNVADPVVKLEKDGVDSGKTYELPAGVKGGETAIIGIIRYAADVTGTFVLKVLDGTAEVASTTYVAE